MQGQFSGTKVFISALKSASGVILLSSFGTRFHNLGPRKEGLPRTLFHLKCEVVRSVYGFSINSKISVMNSGDKIFLTLKISETSFVDFCDECS